MKVITTAAFALLLLFTIPASAQFQEYDFLKGSTLISMIGTEYVYEVDFNGNKYDFIVIVKENSAEKGLVFDYKMTNASATSGTVYMSDEAKQKGRKQVNNFGGGTLKLNDKTSVWVSNLVYSELEKAGKVKITTDDSETWVSLERKYYNYDFAVKTAQGMRDDIGYMYCETTNGAAKYWIQTGGNPLILKMDLGWTITLKEFRMPK